MGIALSSGDALADRRAAYAAAYAEAGDHAAAADLMRQALELAPGWAAGWTALSTYREKAGDGDGAAEALRQAARLDPDDASGAQARLAALGRAAVPDTLPPAFVRALFDGYADRFERQLRDRLAYRAPEHLADAIRATAGDDRRFGVALDLGCGTGLMGALLRPLADRLAGIDLSPRMLALAKAKGVYDELHAADILQFAAADGAFDLVAAADVLNYLGELAPVFRKTARWLKPDGLFAFTVEAHEGAEPFVLRDTMRYAHSGEAVAALLDDAGFTLIGRSPTILREDRGEPVRGWVFAAGLR